ncbi:MAG: DUF1846 domain-containing protein [Coriobacteriia bacterium]|nr:DUF1846 domain-containing protein [Coriobacteriia bacterium]
MNIGFDNEKYINLQAASIRKRIDKFGGKLYMEFGGKLFDDHHASRVLPGFQPDSKIRMLKELQDDVEIVIIINALDIVTNKTRSDIDIPYSEDVLRLIDVFHGLGFYVGSVVITRYSGQSEVDDYISHLDDLGVKSYKHHTIERYPYDIDHLVSEDGFGKNEYIETERPLIVVTAPGPGSGKMATCLSQLYHENLRDIEAGYAKFETFPVWNLPLKHPVNIAYEAATVDLEDRNAIDPFHLEAYGKTAVNYNRDVESFPVLQEMMNRISGKCPYKSPTDMGVNQVGMAIVDNDIVCNAACNEIVRRYYKASVKDVKKGNGREEVAALKLLMKQVGMDPQKHPLRLAALKREETTNHPAGAMMLPNGEIITGKTTDLLGCASSLLLNALKIVANVEDVEVITDEAITPISMLKINALHNKNPRLHSDETLIALSISSAADERAKRMIEAMDQLRGCDAFFSVIVSNTDENLYKKLGINVCCEPKFERHSLYHA